LLDESTLLKITVIIIYIRAWLLTIDDEDALDSTENIFVGLAEASRGTTADGVFRTVTGELA
jgi:hypothetical protein